MHVADSVAKTTYSGERGSIGIKLFNLLFGTYPMQYDAVVAQSAAKDTQYSDMVNFIPFPQLGGKIVILEPGPSMRDLLSNALVEDGRNLEDYDILPIDKFLPMIGHQRNTVQGELQNLPIKSQSVDVVFVSSVLLFISDKDRALAEAYRIVKPGGRVIISELRSDVSAKQLSANVLKYEIAKIKADIDSSKVSRIEYYYILFSKLVERFGPKMRYIIGSILRNMMILKNQDELAGFSEVELKALLTEAGFSIEQVLPTYADSYHLIVADKSAVSES